MFRLDTKHLAFLLFLHLPTHFVTTGRIHAEVHQEPVLVKDGDWKQQLKSKDPEEVLKAIEQIGSSGEKAKESLEELIEVLGSEHPEVVHRAALVIGAMGPTAIRAAPKLIETMKDGEAYAPKDEEFIWITSSRALFGLGPKTIPLLIDAIEQAEPPQFSGICGALHDFGPLAQPALPQLIEKAEREPHLRWAAMYVMEAIGPPSVDAMSVLLKGLEDPDFQQQVMACRVLAAIGPKAFEAKSLLFDLVETGNPSVRGRAAIAIGSIGITRGDHRQVLDSLKALLADPNQIVRERAIIGIGNLGKEGQPLIEEVQRALDNRTFYPKCQACVALYRISGDVKLPLEKLIALLDHVDYELAAIVSLGDIGPDAVEALPHLLRKMKSDDLSYALEGLSAIGKMGPVAKDALPTLMLFSQSTDPEVRIAARAAIEKVEAK